eukprot:30237-Pelagococcus_subviridis.AAC.5
MSTHHASPPQPRKDVAHRRRERGAVRLARVRAEPVAIDPRVVRRRRREARLREREKRDERRAVALGDGRVRIEVRDLRAQVRRDPRHRERAVRLARGSPGVIVCVRAVRAVRGGRAVDADDVRALVERGEEPARGHVSTATHSGESDGRPHRAGHRWRTSSPSAFAAVGGVAPGIGNAAGGAPWCASRPRAFIDYLHHRSVADRDEGQQRVAARLLASDVTIGTNDARAPTAHTPARTRARERNHERRGRREADYDLGSRGGRRDHGDALVRRGGARVVLPPSIDLVPRASPRLVRVDALSPRLPAERGSTRRRRTRRSSLARSPRGASAR